MTEEEFSATIAQKVMGWKPEPATDPIWWVSPEGSPKPRRQYVDYYMPRAELKQAMEALWTSGMGFHISRERVVVYPTSDHWTSFERFHDGTPEDIANAICKLLLMQLREKGDL